MGVFHFSFTYDELFKAYDDCIRHKKNSPNAVNFMINKNENVIQLCDEINDRSYTIGQSISFIIKYRLFDEWKAYIQISSELLKIKSVFLEK
jgi:hypothetical protein